MAGFGLPYSFMAQSISRMIWLSKGLIPSRRYRSASTRVMAARRLYTTPPNFFFSSRNTVESAAAVP